MPDSWFGIAVFDHMVHTGELREVPQPHCMTQHRIFTK